MPTIQPVRTQQPLQTAVTQRGTTQQSLQTAVTQRGTTQQSLQTAVTQHGTIQQSLQTAVTQRGTTQQSSAVSINPVIALCFPSYLKRLQFEYLHVLRNPYLFHKHQCDTEKKISFQQSKVKINSQFRLAVLMFMK